MTDIDDILGVRPQGRPDVQPIPIGAQRHLRRPTSRRCIESMRAPSAIAALNGLPADGETWHCLMDGTYDGFDLVAAVLHHAAPAGIAELNLATLGFNAVNMQALLRMLDRGHVGRATMIVSCWYQSDPREAEVCATLAGELARRGGWYAAARSHAKVQLMELSDGRCFVVESSANLRTCRSIEQFTITQDRRLLLFHRRWMEQVHDASRSSRSREGDSPAGLGHRPGGPEDSVH